jgi:hypothetical protein
MIHQAPIDWSRLPHARRQRLIVLPGQLVEHQLASVGMREETANERLPLADPPSGGPPGQREDPAVTYAAPGGGLRSPVHAATSRAPPGVDASAIRPRVDRAVELRWSPERVRVIDENPGGSGATAEGRPGFQRLMAEVGLDHIGIVLGIEISRLARLVSIAGGLRAVLNADRRCGAPDLRRQRIALGGCDQGINTTSSS